MNKKRVGYGVGRLAFVLMVLGCSLSALADGYVTLKKNVGYSGTNPGFAGSVTAKAWSDNEAVPSENDYLVANNLYFHTSSGETVPTRSMTIGEVGGTPGIFGVQYEGTFDNNGLVLANGSINRRLSGSAIIRGQITIASPASAPFKFYDLSTDGKTFREEVGFLFPGKFSGAESTGFEILAHTNGMIVTLSGDASEFKGTATLCTSGDFCDCASARLCLSDTDFGGHVTCKSNTSFATSGSMSSSLRSLTLEEGASMSLTTPLMVGDLILSEPLSFTLNKTTLACPAFITITNSISRTTPGRIQIEIKNSDYIPIPPSEPLSVSLFSLPIGSGLDEDSFEIVQTAKIAANRMHLRKQVDNDGHAEIYSLEVYPVISRASWPNERLDFGGSGGSNYDMPDVSLNLATNASTESAWWEDETTPHSRAHYRVDRVVNPTSGGRSTTYVRTPYLPNGSFAFPGESLALAQSVHLVLMSHDFHVRQLSVGSGNLIICSTLSDTTVHGEIYTGSNIAKIQPNGGKLFTHDGMLTGSAGVEMKGRGVSNDDVAGKVYFAGTNTLFTGKINLSFNISYNNGSLVTPRWKSNRYLTLYVSNPLNLGAPRAEFSDDALAISNMCELRALEDVDFTDQTRGISFGWIAQLTTPAATTMTLRQPMAVNATVYKNGAGTLALGGRLSFRDENGDLTDAIPADATNRTLQVTAGTLKLLAARSVDGLDVVFARNTNVSGSTDQRCFFELDPFTEDAELAQYGAINLKAETPFALGPTQDKVEIVIPAGTEVPDEGRRVPICTVKASAAEEVAGVFKVNRVFMSGDAKFKVAIIQKSVTLDDTQAVTIEANITPPGGTIILIK